MTPEEYQKYQKLKRENEQLKAELDNDELKNDLVKFHQKLISNLSDMEPEFQEIVNKYFMDLI